MRVAFIHSRHVALASDAIDAHQSHDQEGNPIGRNSMVFSLIEATGLLDRLRVVPPSPMTLKQACNFHEEEYIRALFRWKDMDSDSLKRYNLVDDANPFEHVEKHALWIAGATMTAVKEILSGHSNIAINLYGGRHHAMRATASGFCFINDVVLSALALQESFNKVMIVDIDVHHGDGTEAAFYLSNKVFTMSMHQYYPGFFPGTGSPHDIGSGKGLGFNLNIPVNPGTRGSDYIRTFIHHFKQQAKTFQPSVVVLVCGVDALANDPRGGLCLKPSDICECVRAVAASGVPVLVLGGGGYQFPDAARCWTKVVALLAEYNLPNTVPDHQYFEMYGPSWSL